MARVTVERWLVGEPGEGALEVVFHEEAATFEILDGSQIVFAATDYAAVLRWLLEGVD